MRLDGADPATTAAITTAIETTITAARPVDRADTTIETAGSNAIEAADSVDRFVELVERRLSSRVRVSSPRIHRADLELSWGG